MIDFAVILILLLIVGLAAYYIRRAKKKGRKCIGCPYSAACEKKNCDSHLQ